MGAQASAPPADGGAHTSGSSSMAVPPVRGAAPPRLRSRSSAAAARAASSLAADGCGCCSSADLDAASSSESEEESCRQAERAKGWLFSQQTQRGGRQRTRSKSMRNFFSCVRRAPESRLPRSPPPGGAASCSIAREAEPEYSAHRASAAFLKPQPRRGNTHASETDRLRPIAKHSQLRSQFSRVEPRPYLIDLPPRHRQELRKILQTLRDGCNLCVIETPARAAGRLGRASRANSDRAHNPCPGCAASTSRRRRRFCLIKRTHGKS